MQDRPRRGQISVLEHGTASFGKRQGVLGKACSGADGPSMIKAEHGYSMRTPVGKANAVVRRAAFRGPRPH